MGLVAFYEKTVMKILLSALFFLIMGLQLKAQTIVNDPNVEARHHSNFRAIEINGAFDVVITQGDKEGVAVSARNQEDIPKIITEVEKGVLKISFSEKKFWPKDRKLRAYISVIDVVEIDASGASRIKIDGSLSADYLKIELSGATDMEGKIFVSGRFEVELHGASDLDIAGNTRELDIQATGASKMKTFNFTTGVCNAKASGASSIHLTVEKEISAKLTGASSLRYAGDAVIREIHTSGASSIAKR